MNRKSTNQFLHEKGLFYTVEKPSRYIGNEYNGIKKIWDTKLLKFLLVFPDIYDIGMSHLGLKVLYEILNKNNAFLAERSFLPWKDLLAIMESEDLEPFSLESYRSPNEFDVLGFTLQYELSYPGMLKYLQLAHINPYTRDRTENDPLIIAGGPCVYNPEPIAEFVDAFLIGDGEEAIIEIGESLLKTTNLPKIERLYRLVNDVNGIYVPIFYEQIDGYIQPKSDVKYQVPKRIQKRIAPLTAENDPLHQLVPFTQTIHDRGVVEVMRGCTRGCRFCHAGMVYRPSRERSKEEIIKACYEILKNTGFDEISLLSLSTLDHSEISEITDVLIDHLNEKKISLSIPSSRVDQFGVDIAEKVSHVRKTGLTVAPEAGTQRMRDRINKNINENQIFEMIKIALSKGWKRVKLYYMAGLPFETEGDLSGIIETVKKCRQLGMKNISVSVSGFIPKPHTPFQFAAQNSVHEMHSKIRKLSVLKNFSNFEFHRPEISFIEGVLSRGDRNLSKVLLKVVEKGGYLEAWKDQFSYERWSSSFKEFGITPEKYIRARGFKERLPWDHIDSGIKREFLIKEYQNSFIGFQTNDCKRNECTNCGVCFDLEDSKTIMKFNHQGGKAFD
ncbi:MAG TPA: TIGR03960 family B12-binding radical SAM protein [Bacteroidales bacterium]|nr:TIGR03960 family B12-binding radical SAM protein [Bacteroidales bacterium]HPJ12739.1 TIGR03960 family B12-binding radical SAM protein [Caldisericia bacterium]HRW33700.1 TIGR03960 family B12-binding radical SAM protein [Thermotogota bacterium]